MERKIRQVAVDEINRGAANTIMEAIGIRVTAVREDEIEGTMPVDHRTHQVYGLLHGGASVVLAETLGSIASMLTVDPEKFRCVGIEVNANHLGSVRSGLVTGVARPLHLGRSTQVWEIRISNDEGKLICISRLTVAVVPLK